MEVLIRYNAQQVQSSTLSKLGERLAVLIAEINNLDKSVYKSEDVTVRFQPHSTFDCNVRDIECSVPLCNQELRPQMVAHAVLAAIKQIDASGTVRVTTHAAHENVAATGYPQD